MRLNLGCCDQLLPGWINVDLVAPPGVNVIDRTDFQFADLREKWPWPDSSVEAIRAFDVIEHLPDKIHTMNEAWRVMAPGARMEIFVPLFPGSGSVQDPTHVSFWVERSFLYFEAGNIYRDRFAHGNGVKAKFRTIAKQVNDSVDGPKLRITLEAVKP